MNSIVSLLKQRKLFYDITNHSNLSKLSQTVYLGIDPTANSLHVGHLLGLITLKRFQEQGFKPIILIGGATGLIGDPSFRTDLRDEMSTDILQININSIKKSVSNLFKDEDSLQPLTIVNNYDWFKDISALELLKDLGSSFKVKSMLSRDSMKNRMDQNDNTGGLTFTELSYQLLQAYDFYYLLSNFNCPIQIGGSDQWGNIVSGCEYIRKKTAKEGAVGLTFPLLTDKNGDKFGKSSGKPIWLDKEKTSVLDFYNFFHNLPDDKIDEMLLRFTKIPIEEVEKLNLEQKKSPKERIIQKILGKSVTEFVHGKKETELALQKVTSLFSENTEITEKEPNLILTPSHHNKVLVEVLVEHGLFKSRNEAKRIVNSKGLFVNSITVELDDLIKPIVSFAEKDIVVIRKGKKTFFVVKFEF